MERAIQSTVLSRLQSLLDRCLLNECPKWLRPHIPAGGLFLCPFGSTPAGLASKGSDVDLVILARETRAAPSDPTVCVAILKTFATFLRRFPKEFAIFTLFHARVPLIKLQSIQYGLSCDISITTTSHYAKTRLLQGYCAVDPRVPQLIRTVKHWSKTRRVA